MVRVHLKKCEKDAFKLSIVDSVDLINKKHWEEIRMGKNIYLSIPYLTALEKSLDGEVGFRYLIMYDDDVTPIGIAYIQILQFQDIGDNYEDYIPKFGDKVSKGLLNSLDVKIMCCGNAYCSGENGYMYAPQISGKTAFTYLENALQRLRANEKSKNNASVFLLKEYWEDSFEESDHAKDHKFRDFMIDVNMVMHLNGSWDSFEDYLQSMNTKFRTKAKAAFKRSADLEIKALSHIDLEDHESELNKLFDNVMNRAGFKFGELNGSCFINFKKHLGDDNIVLGYYLNNELIGFSSSFIDGDNFDANYVGINYDYNKDYAIYSRMLYDFVEMAISKGIKELRLGRTAEEIKSGVGALPVNMKLYIKHANKLSNTLLKGLVKNIVPNDYTLRKPFKNGELPK